MELSYWEYKTWLSNIDFTIVGSGIVGLNTALQLKNRFPKAKILILEKGVLPQGASTKNAGFACFGSISELSSDLHSMSEKELVNLVAKRLKAYPDMYNYMSAHMNFVQKKHDATSFSEWNKSLNAYLEIRNVKKAKDFLQVS